MVHVGTGGRWREGIEIIGGRGMFKDCGPITLGPNGGIGWGIGWGIDGGICGPIGAELIGGPRLREGRFEPMGDGIGAELTGHIGGGPIGATEFGNWESLEW